MINKKYLIVFFLFFHSSISFSGTINVNGEISDNTCVVSSESREVTVELGDVSTKQFSSIGSGSRFEPFYIKLENCGASASNVDIMFSGKEDTSDSQLLSIQKASDSSSGIAIGIYDDEKELLPINTFSSSSYIYSSQPVLVLSFFARYVSTELDVRGGSADGSVTFYLNYA